jgi:hypothetical protein
VIGVLAAVLFAACGTARAAAVPLPGVWESTGTTEPRVGFAVAGPARSRFVLHVSFRLTCKGQTVGWASTDWVRTRHGRRFTATDGASSVRGRFTADNRAQVTVRSHGGDGCRDTRRYLVIHHRHPVAVPTGRFLSLVGGGAAVGLETTVYGRMVDVEFMDGTMPADCADGSQRSLPLAGPAGYVLAAPVRLNGRFDIAASAGSTTIAISGSFDGGSVAAFVQLTVTLPGGLRCTARAQPLVGSLAYPLPTGAETITPSDPVIPIHPG